MNYSNPAAYELFMGRWSARLTPSFLRFAEVQDGQHVLGVGCGTGILSRALVSCGAMIRVTGIDPVLAYVSFALEEMPDSRAQFEVGAAETLPFSDGTFDAALALLVLQDFADPAQAVSEMRRVAQFATGNSTLIVRFGSGADIPTLPSCSGKQSNAHVT